VNQLKNILSALLKTLLLTAVYFIVNAVVGVLLPLSHDMIAALPPEEQALFMPLFLLNTFLNVAVLLTTLSCLRYKGWKLVLAGTISFFGLFGVLNVIELIWYNESFPLITYLDTVKMMLTNILTYGTTALVGTWLTKGFKKEEQVRDTVFGAGRYGWKIGLFSVLYPLFYYCCGFIPWAFPEVREFYAGWDATRESIPVLLLFNVFRGALWFAFSLPILLGATTRKRAFWLLPLVMVTGTAMSFITPNPYIPPMVRVGHFIELAFSMTVVGVFMVWLFLKEKNGQVKSE
jgi:hypothetical protein